tara:strand:+ start:83 stop:286 length:204 start_codon:yes stop_codon:yes gene_type:complete
MKSAFLVILWSSEKFETLKKRFIAYKLKGIVTMLKDVLEGILEHFPNESQSDFKNNYLAYYIRHDGA